MSDPTPLFDDPSIGSILRAGAESHEPSAADLASLAKKLPGGMPPAGGAAGGALKLAAAVGVIALIGGGAYVAGGKNVVPAAPVASVSAVPVASVALEPLVVPVEPAPTASASAAPVVSAIVTPPTEPEGTMLARAHDALLHGAPDRALAIANEHAKAYPHGALAQERDVIAIEALVASGRKPEAARKAAAFRAAYPGSSHQERIDRLVAP